MCHTKCNDNAPWIALEFSGPVKVTKVVIYNRDDGYGSRFRNVEVRLADELPTSGDQMYNGGQLLGTFAGPGGKGEIIKVEGAAMTGRYVLIQMNNKDCLNLHEVEAFGRVALDTESGESNTFCGKSKNLETQFQHFSAKIRKNTIVLKIYKN